MSEAHYRYVGSRTCCEEDCHDPADYIVVDRYGKQVDGERCYLHAYRMAERMRQFEKQVGELL